jgi:hypothetical protein
MKAIGALGAMVALTAATVGLLVTLGVLRTVPDVTDMSGADAANRLVASGFQIQQISQPSDTVAEGKVIRTDPNANTPAWKGSKVTIYVSSGRASNTNSWKVIASGVRVDFPSGQCLNLDTGQEYCGFDYDIVTPLGNEFVSPANGAIVVSLGVMDQAQFDALNPNKLLGLKYASDPIQQSAVNTVIAVKTSRGNYAKVLVVRAGQDKLLTYATYGPS